MREERVGPRCKISHVPSTPLMVVRENARLIFSNRSPRILKRGTFILKRLFTS
jgi:hypothetical protein